ncbi:hypothetical protein BDR04DRAFT_1123070 [Suillus decipiens]|nr:hypothetical protein BDR04DRAFT_1123070 [Suillus decipiens]
MVKVGISMFSVIKEQSDQEENDNESDESDEDEGKGLHEASLLYWSFFQRAIGIGLSDILCILHFTEVFTNTAKPVPWHEVVGKPTLYLNPKFLPKGFILRDPSHMRTENINELWACWEARKAAKKPLVIFMAGKIGDMSKKQLKNAVPYKGKITMDYIEIDAAKTSSTTGAASACPTPTSYNKAGQG